MKGGKNESEKIEEIMKKKGEDVISFSRYNR